MTATLRSYDHYAPHVAATVLPGAVVQTSPYRGGAFGRRASTAGTPVRVLDGAQLTPELVRLDEQLEAYAMAPGPVGATYREVSWLDSAHLGTEWALAQVLAQGYPTVGLDELRRRLRRGGYRVAADELTVSDAISATQAAVWHIAAGRALDVRRGNALAVVHLYEYLLARAGVAGYGAREVSTVQGPSFLVAGVSVVEVVGAEVVDAEGRSLAGVVQPGQRFHLRGRATRIALRHGAVRARLLSGDSVQLVTLTSQSPVVTEHLLG